MPTKHPVHINMERDGDKVDLGSEILFEIRNRIGEIGRNGDKGVGLAFAKIKRSEPHWHDATNEYYLIVAGSGTATIDGRRVRLEPLDWLEMPIGAVHNVTSRKGIELVAITSPPWSKEDHHLMSEKRK